MLLILTVGTWQCDICTRRCDEKSLACTLQRFQIDQATSGLSGWQQSNLYDSLRFAERSRFHGNFEHTEVRQSSKKHQEQGDDQPGQEFQNNRFAQEGDTTVADGTAGV